MFNAEKIEQSDYMLLALFVSEAKSKCRQMLILFDDLEKAIAEVNISANSDRVFVLLQSVLLMSAQLSFIFHPSRSPENERRSERLRGAFGIPKAIEFLADRSFRNHIAHMDERLHSWSKQSPNRNIVRQVYGPRNSVGGNALTPDDVFEHYVPEEHVFIFRGDEFDINSLKAVVDLIEKRASAMDSLPWWSPKFKSLFSVL